MSRVKRTLVINAQATTDLRLHDHADLGAALLLVMFEAGGHIAPDDHARARVCGVSRTVWKRRGPAIMVARDELVAHSQPGRVHGRASPSAATRARILARDGEVCRYCQATAGPFHIDHVVPVARGGTDRDENLCVACAPCNFAKSASLNSEWAW